MYDQQKKNVKSIGDRSEYKLEHKKSRWRKEKSSGPSIFISKTFQILQNNYYQDVVAWNEEGTNFIIIDVDKFQQEILPIYFRHRNFSSFVRQLNMYDFHKIRNEQNKNIFEHKEFRREARHLLKNIKRKGCNTKKSGSNADEGMESESSSLLEEQDYYPGEKSRNMRHTIESIEKISHSPPQSLKVIPQSESLTPHKNIIIEEFVNSLPQVLESEQQIKQIIKEMKKDSKFKCISSKQDIRKVIKKIRRKKLMKNHIEDDLQQLSIEQEIMVHNIDGQQLNNPTLAILSSENYLPQRSISFIGSLILCEDLLFSKMS